MEITIQDIRKAIDKLRPYKLYGSKEQIEKVRDILPANVEPIELPNGYIPRDDEMILVDIRELEIK